MKWPNILYIYIEIGVPYSTPLLYYRVDDRFCKLFLLWDYCGFHVYTFMDRRTGGQKIHRDIRRFFCAKQEHVNFRIIFYYMGDMVELICFFGVRRLFLRKGACLLDGAGVECVVRVDVPFNRQEDVGPWKGKRVHHAKRLL